MKTRQLCWIILPFIIWLPTVARGYNNIKQDATSQQEAVRMIKDFYVGYATNFLSDMNLNGLLMKSSLTGSLIDRLGRIRNATGADPIIRAQDFSKEAIETIEVKHLEENWYMVSYDWHSFDGTDRTDIPVRVMKTGNRYMIDYITPEWNGNLYGDDLLCNNYNPGQDQISFDTPLSFLETFYKTYTSAYSTMPVDLNRQLESLRTNYLTPAAVAQHEAAGRQCLLEDGFRNYDLLIDNFDFDCLWIPEIKYTRLDGESYQINYSHRDIFGSIIIKIIKKGGEYRIDSINKSH